MLPGSLQEEDEGTVTQVEGRIIKINKAVDCPGEAREDWRIIQDLAKALGRPHGFTFESPRAIFDEHGAVTNLDEAVGELVNTQGAGFFGGYYNDERATAERLDGGMFWSGDLAYRDDAGFVYLAGRTADWLRVDGENLAAAPIETILLRHPAVSQAAVYGVPDPDVGADPPGPAQGRGGPAVRGGRHR